MMNPDRPAPENIYLAARYSRASEMQGVRDVLQALGYHVTSRWIDHHGGKFPGSFTPEQLNTDPEYCGKIAKADVEDIMVADTVISFSSGDGANGKGGRHVEFGIGVAMEQRLILVGPREHVFHALPDVEQYDDWAHLVVALTPAHLKNTIAS